MTPIMLKENEFVISFGKGMNSVKIVNPHKPGEFESLDHEALKKLLDKAIMLMDNDRLEKATTVKASRKYTDDEIKTIYAEYCRDHPNEKVPYNDFVANIGEKPLESINITPITSKSLAYEELLDIREAYKQLGELGMDISNNQFLAGVELAINKIERDINKTFTNTKEADT